MLSDAVRMYARTAGPECQAEQQGVLPNQGGAQILISRHSAVELDRPTQRVLKQGK